MSATHTSSGAGYQGVLTVDSVAQAERVTLVGEDGAAVNPSALPTGAATSAKQDTGNTSLASIDGKIPASPATSGKQDTGNASLGLMEPAANGAAITPNDGADLAANTRGLYVGVAGDVKVDFVTGGTGIILKALAAGVIHPLRVKRVHATGTTATDIVGVY